MIFLILLFLEIDILSEPYKRANLATEYLRKAIHFDRAILEYLIDQGVPFDDRLMGLAVSRDCTLDLILWLINKGAKMYEYVAADIMSKHLLDLTQFKIIFNSVAPVNERKTSEELMKRLLEIVTAGKYEKNPANGKRGRLIRLAWKFGNEDNNFKVLPREIVELICSFNVDKPDWWEIAEYLTSKATVKALPTAISYQSLLPILPFVWQYWDRFSPSTISSFTALTVGTTRRMVADHPKKEAEIVNWSIKLVTAVQKCHIVSSYATSEVFKFIMENELAVPLFEAIMKYCGSSNFLEYYLKPNSPLVLDDSKYPTITPAVWTAALMNNRSMLKYLVEKDHLHFRHPANSFERLSALVATHGRDQSVLEYIKQLVKDEAIK
jgi:hypothetical protein